MHSTFKHVLATTVLLILGMAVLLTIFIWSGVYNFAADVPHTAVVRNLLEAMRERSIEIRVAGIQVPAIGEDTSIIRGAGNYDAMCVQCHRAPGMADTELSKDLYPSPPDLSKKAPDAAHAFWVIKHGVKASGIPAWGKSMSDKDIWELAGFLQTLPQLDHAKYKDIVGQSNGHSHGEGPGHAAHDTPVSSGNKGSALRASGRESSEHLPSIKGEKR